MAENLAEIKEILQKLRDLVPNDLAELEQKAEDWLSPTRLDSWNHMRTDMARQAILDRDEAINILTYLMISGKLGVCSMIECLLDHYQDYRKGKK